MSAARLVAACTLAATTAAAATRPVPAHAAPAAARRDAVIEAMAAAGAADAPIVVRVDAAGLAALLDAARARIPSFLRGGLDDQLAALATTLGGDPLSPAGWPALGLDPARPAIVAIGRTSGPWLLARAGAHAPLIAAGERPASRPPARVTILIEARVILPVADPAAADRAAARAAPLLVATGLRIAITRPTPRTLAIDLVRATPAADEADVQATLALVIAARSSRDAVRARLADPTAAALAGRAPIAAHVDPLRLGETLAWRRLGDSTSAPNADTLALLRDLLRPVIPILSGPLGDLGLAADVRDGALHVTATWAVAPRSPLARVLAHPIDSGLPRPADTPGAALHLHSYLADLNGLAALPSVGMTFNLPPEPYFPYGGLSPLLELMSAPYAVGAAIAHVERAEPRATKPIAGLRDLVVVVARVGSDFASSDGAFEAALAPDASTSLRAVATALWGDSATASGVTTWGHGPVRAFARTIDGVPTLGAAIRDSGPAYLALVRAAPAPPPGTVGELHASAAALGLLHPLASLAGRLDVLARWDGHALVLEAILSPTP